MLSLALSRWRINGAAAPMFEFWRAAFAAAKGGAWIPPDMRDMLGRCSLEEEEEEGEEKSEGVRTASADACAASAEGVGIMRGGGGEAGGGCRFVVSSLLLSGRDC